jgi:hypothetical protein
LTDTAGKTWASGQWGSKTIATGTLAPLGTVTAPMSGTPGNQKLTLTVRAGSFKNTWDIWVYERTLPEPDMQNVVIAHTPDEALPALALGRRVLLLPDVERIDGKKADFQNHFWCPIMFRWDPMSMGTLVRSQHPAFKNFTTDFFTEWQWWDIVSHARILNLDETDARFRPLVQVIDTYDRCLKEGLVIEACVGKGRLLMASIDFDKNMDRRPAARQLLRSLKMYAAGSEFRPKSKLTPNQVRKFFKEPTLLSGAKVILADSYETGNEPELAIDDNPGTIWHTAYSSPGTFAVTSKQPETDYPHELQIELAQETEFAGIRCVPRSDGVNGYVAQCEFYASNDPKNWGEPVARATFSRDAKVKTVMFDKSARAKFIRFVAVRGFAGQKWASMAELQLIPVSKP